jgi:glyoxylase-like metal-dependent hydrolase (beta-lactamase superfamily II)
MFVHTIPVGVFRCNCTILGCEATGKAIVIDPGDEPDRVLEIIRVEDLTVEHVLHTHAHIDHVMGTCELVEATGAPARLHSGDLRLWGMVGSVAEKYCIPAPKMPPLGELLRDGEVIPFGDASVRVIYTPGHTSGSCCFDFEIAGRKTLLSGDTLFRGKIGIASPYPSKIMNSERIVASIRQRLLSLEDDTRVLPGHGPETLIGVERRTNPFL